MRNRPNILDLRWEVLRRNPQYISDYNQLKNNPKWADEVAGNNGPLELSRSDCFSRHVPYIVILNIYS